MLTFNMISYVHLYYWKMKHCFLEKNECKWLEDDSSNYSTTDIFSTMMSKLIKIAIWSQMKKVFFSIQKKKLVPECRRCNFCTEWHIYWLFVWWVKIMHLVQVQKMTQNEQASCNALLARLNHCLSASLYQLHLGCSILLRLVLMMLWGVQELNFIC